MTTDLQAPDLPTLNEVRELKSPDEIIKYLDLNDKYAEIESDNPSEVPPKRSGTHSYSTLSSPVSDSFTLQEVVVTGSRAAEESITNNQEKGVDQGDIIKRLGDYLLVLRKGVLYSVFMGNEHNSEMRLITKLPVQSNGEDHDSWYDELLVNDNLLLVIGFSYDLDASEMVFFKLSPDGSFAFHQRYLIKADDYYDSENSATRIVDGKLIMVFPTWADTDELRESIIEGKVNARTVGLYRTNSSLPELIELVSNQDWIQTSQKLDDYDIPISQVFSCPLDSIKHDHLSCSSVNLLGARGKFYVSPSAVYIWDSNSPRSLDYRRIDPDRYALLSRQGALDKWENDSNASVIYRVPHDDSAVSAVVVQGEPLNQFSFQEKGTRFAVISTLYREDNDQYFHDTYGLEFPLSTFSASSIEIEPDQYTLISSNNDRPSANRFLNKQVFVSTSMLDDNLGLKTDVRIWDIESNNVEAFDADFDIQAFHPLGENMLAMGADQRMSLVLESWSTGPLPKSLQIQKFPNYSSTESRSVGFNSSQYDEATVFGIPIIEHEDVDVRQSHYWGDDELPMDIAFFESSQAGTFKGVGQLLGSREKFKEDDCKVSCVDWYGVARPFFIGEYIYGLIDFEILKAIYSETEINTLQRLNIQTGELNFQ